MNINTRCQVFNLLLFLGICQKSEFGCGNGFCIGRHLECNGYNNCGNDIDELACVVALAAGIIVVIIIGSILAIICFVTAIMCLVCRPRRRNIYTRIWKYVLEKKCLMNSTVVLQAEWNMYLGFDTRGSLTTWWYSSAYHWNSFLFNTLYGL